MTLHSTANGSTDSTPCRNTPTASVNTSAEPSLTTKHRTSLYQLTLEDQEIDVELVRSAELFMSDDPEEQALGEELTNQYLSAKEHQGTRIVNRADEILDYVSLLKGIADWRKKESERLSNLAKYDQNKAKKIEDYVLKFLGKNQPEKKEFVLPHHTYRSRKSSSVEVTDEFIVPTEFRNAPIPHEAMPVNKTMARKHLKSGHSIPGLKLMENINWNPFNPKPKSKPQPTLKQQEPPQLSPATEEDEGW